MQEPIEVTEREESKKFVNQTQSLKPQVLSTRNHTDPEHTAKKHRYQNSLETECYLSEDSVSLCLSKVCC